MSLWWPSISSHGPHSPACSCLTSLTSLPPTLSFVHCSRHGGHPSSKSSFCSCLRAFVLVPLTWNAYRPCLPPSFLLLVIHFKGHLFKDLPRSLCIELPLPTLCIHTHTHTHTALNLITLLYLLYGTSLKWSFICLHGTQNHCEYDSNKSKRILVCCLALVTPILQVFADATDVIFWNGD